MLRSFDVNWESSPAQPAKPVSAGRWAVKLKENVMPIPSEIISKAYAIYEEFGPNRLIDRKERLMAELHITSQEEIDELLKILKNITNAVWKIAEKGGEIKLGKEEVERQVLQSFPYLQGKGLDKATSLVNYFAWHEGYDK